WGAGRVWGGPGLGRAGFGAGRVAHGYSAGGGWLDGYGSAAGSRRAAAPVGFEAPVRDLEQASRHRTYPQAIPLPRRPAVELQRTGRSHH
ncbi:MAG: hypothetical protein M3456_08320, partial [Actinomycetota bacterium]|nr:hypothetical protein [Actinomycetota bacterium]